MTIIYTRENVEPCVTHMMKSILMNSTESNGVEFIGDERVVIGNQPHDIPDIEILERRVCWQWEEEANQTSTEFNIHYINVMLKAMNDHIKKDRHKYVGNYIHTQIQQLKKWRTKLHNRRSEEGRGIVRQNRRPLDYNAKSKTLAEGAVLESEEEQLPFIKPADCPHEIWYIGKQIHREFTDINLKFETRPLVRKDRETDKRYHARIVSEYIRIIHFNLRRQTAYNCEVLNTLKAQLEAYRTDITKGLKMEVYCDETYNVVGDIITDIVGGMEFETNAVTEAEDEEVSDADTEEYEYPTDEEDDEVSDAETIPYEEEEEVEVEEDSYSVVRDILTDIVNGIWSVPKVHVPKPKRKLVFKIKRN